MEETEILTDKKVYSNPEEGTNTRALKPGTVLNDQYQIEKVIGEGGFGITYAAYDKYLRIRVAIKEYFPAQFASRNTYAGSNTISVISGEREKLFDEGLKSYEYEGARLTKLSNLKGIVSVLNFFRENGTAYMVMEFVEGCTLKDYLDENGGIVSWQMTLQMMQPVIFSLKKIHEEGIIHRDISPDNIMISKDGEIKIIDFGAARYADDGKSKTIMLKHGYAPPEQYYKHGNQGPWTDVYALCAVIYRMLTGKKLPDAMSIMGKTRVREPISKYAAVPDFIENVIARGTEPEIEDRIKSVDELEKYLYQNMKIGMSSSKKRKMTSAVIVGAVSFVTICVVTVAAILVINSAKNSLESSNDTSDKKKSSASASNDRESDAKDSKNAAADGAENTITGDSDSEVAAQMTKEEIPDSFSKASVPKEIQITVSDYNDGVKIDGLDDSLTDVRIPETVNGKNVLAISGVSTNIISVVLPYGMESIEKNAFKNCVYLERVYIPATVDSIASNAFDNCLSLKEIVVAGSNQNYFVVNNSLQDKDGNVIFDFN